MGIDLKGQAKYKNFITKYFKFMEGFIMKIIKKNFFWGMVGTGIICLFFNDVDADPFSAVAEKVSHTTKGILKIGSVGCGLAGALLILQAVFGKFNFRWGISFVIASILLASFEYVIGFLTGS